MKFITESKELIREYESYEVIEKATCENCFWHTWIPSYGIMCQNPNGDTIFFERLVPENYVCDGWKIWK